MSEFHAILNPGVLNNITETLTISFDSPDSANDVVLTLKEVDRWGRRREAVTESGGGRDDFIVEFRGQIVAGQFTGAISRQGRATEGAPVLRVHLDGEPEDTIYELAIPSDRNEREQGIFEIQLEGTGRIDGRRKTYRTSQPVFVRNFVQDRPIISFITGSGGYFTAASHYWQINADGRFDRSSAEEILAYLRTESERLGYGLWGQVNIVSHGNELEWLIKLFRSDSRARHVIPQMLRDNAEDERLAAPDNSQLDNESTIVIRGCALGNSQELLDEIRNLFGGRSNIYAPKYIQWYSYERRNGNVTAQEYFIEFFYFYVTGTREPNEATCTARFQEKYPDIASDEQWRTMLRDRKYRKRYDPESLPMYLGYADRPERNHDFLQDLQNAWEEERWEDSDNTLRTGFNEWAWTLGALQVRRDPEGARIYRKLFTGRRRRIEVRREFRGEDGNLVVPDLTNSNHYGRSPA
ncbi:MAG: hypothetical protein QME52_05040 [Bacteroidota bacterium]|nr:hypothetical protein [Bacteroidota bacterium]